MVIKYHITKLELVHCLSNSNDSTHSQNGKPSQELLLKFVSRFQESHSDYQPIDVESIKWLTGSLSTERMLSLGPCSCLAAVSFSTKNLRNLRTLRNRIKFRSTRYAINQEEKPSLLTRIEWMERFKYPKEITYFWFDINGILHDAQSSIPKEEYSKNSEWYDQWFRMVHGSWQQILGEVRNHLFFRQFRRIEDIPRFQHSVCWTIFFYRFETERDSGSPHVVELKTHILLDHHFRKGIKKFIDEVDSVLNEVKRVNFSRININADGPIFDAELNRETNEILQSLNPNLDYDNWLIDMFVRANDLWRLTLKNVVDGDPIPFPREIFAAKMLWDVEAIVAYIEPIVFRMGHIHQALLSYRSRIRAYIYQLVLKESWICD